jgi:hypothetical protein
MLAHDAGSVGAAASAARGRLGVRRRSDVAAGVWILVVAVGVPAGFAGVRFVAGGLLRGGRGLPLARNSRMWPAV